MYTEILISFHIFQLVIICYKFNILIPSAVGYPTIIHLVLRVLMVRTFCPHHFSVASNDSCNLIGSVLYNTVSQILGRLLI